MAQNEQLPHPKARRRAARYLKSLGLIQSSGPLLAALQHPATFHMPLLQHGQEFHPLHAQKHQEHQGLAEDIAPKDWFDLCIEEPFDL